MLSGGMANLNVNGEGAEEEGEGEGAAPGMPGGMPRMPGMPPIDPSKYMQVRRIWESGSIPVKITCILGPAAYLGRQLRRGE